MKKREYVVKTKRLYLGKMRVEDAPQVFKWVGDDEVTKFLRYNTYTNLEDVEKWLQSLQNESDTFGIFLQDGTLIGCCCCSLQENGKREIGYNLNRDYWGYGYCTEATMALIAYFAQSKGSRNFIVSHALQNTRSKRVVEKCGFVFEDVDKYSTFDGSQTFTCRKYSLQVRLHDMNLDSSPFEKIVCGTKTVEMRLDDEKRRAICEGDFVTFTNNTTGQQAVVKVVALHRFSNFERLYARMDLTKCGYDVSELATASASDMLRYYSLEKQQMCGVLGLEVQFLALL